MFCKKGALRNFAKFTGKHLCQSLCNFIKKETLVQVFSCDFCKIFKNTFYSENTSGGCSNSLTVPQMSDSVVNAPPKKH